MFGQFRVNGGFDKKPDSRNFGSSKRIPDHVFQSKPGLQKKISSEEVFQSKMPHMDGSNVSPLRVPNMIRPPIEPPSSLDMTMKKECYERESLGSWLMNVLRFAIMSAEQREHFDYWLNILKTNIVFQIVYFALVHTFKGVRVFYVALICIIWLLSKCMPKRDTCSNIVSKMLWDLGYGTGSLLKRFYLMILKLPVLFAFAIIGLLIEIVYILKNVLVRHQ